LGVFKDTMLLFPYAKDIDYKEQTLSFTMQFIGKSSSTEIEVKMPLDSDLSDLIEELLEKNDQFDEIDLGYEND
jgi:hypothetical protein